jgi:hypothetical protein
VSLVGIALRCRFLTGGCKVRGKQMLTDRSPLRHRTCDACKAERRRENHRRTDARRKSRGLRVRSGRCGDGK